MQWERSRLKALVRGTYDIQRLRIMCGNRIVRTFKAKFGYDQMAKLSAKEIDAMFRKLLLDHKTIADGLAASPPAGPFPASGIIADQVEFQLVGMFKQLRAFEDGHFKDIKGLVVQHPIWDAFLRDVRGVDAAMAGVLLATIDIHKATYASSLRKLAGIDVVPESFIDDEGQPRTLDPWARTGRSMRKEHQVMCKRTNRDGKVVEGLGPSYDVWFKTKMCGVLAGCFLMQKGKESKYRDAYDAARNRYQNHEQYGAHNDKKKDANGRSVTGDGRRHRMAIRKMLDVFFLDLYKAWRTVEGLPVHDPYNQDVLRRQHSKAG